MKPNKKELDIDLHLKFLGNRVLINYWEKRLNFEVKDGKIFKYKYSSKEIDDDDLLEVKKIDNIFEQVEITLSDFLELILQSQNNE